MPPRVNSRQVFVSSSLARRELAKFGHTVKLMPPAYVKPYVKRGKNDATDTFNGI
jgi:transposase